MIEQRLKIRGLQTSSNELGSVSEGGLKIGKNIDILALDVAKPRRGFDRATSAGYTDLADRTDRTFFYQDKLFAHHGTFKSADTLSYFDSGSWNTVESVSAPSGYRMRTLKASQNLYYTSSTGIRKIDAYNGTPEDAGIPKALNIESSLTGSSGFLEGAASSDVQVAYRAVWAKIDGNDNLVLGAPSGRTIVTNALGASNDRNVSNTVYIPDGITTSHFCQVYRSEIYTKTTGDDGEPTDELQLVYEAFPSSGEISNGYFTFTDSVPAGLRGAALYTNATQEGLAFQNERPPLAKDITKFRNCTFYFNTISKHRYTLTLISASAMSNDDTITIGGVTYTAKASETVASGYFALATGGTAAQNISDTAKSLVNVINQYSSSTVYAYYLSTTSDLPGKILLEERAIGGAAFVLTTSNNTCWSPAGIPSSGTTETSSNDTYVNGVYWSKPGQSEHVPLVNFNTMGSEDEGIKRAIALQDQIIVFKEDGIYRITGYYPNFDFEELDSSAKLVGSETPSIMNNEIYCLTDLGICRVSNSVEIISLDINQELVEIVNKNTSVIESTAFGVGYESDKKYYLFLPQTTADTYPTFAYVYNFITNGFVNHYLDATAATVYNKTLYYGNGESNFVMQERRNYSYLDYADFGFASTVTAINSLILDIGSGVDNISAGDIIYQSDTVFATVQEVDKINAKVTIDQDPGFSVGACDVLYSIDTEIQWAVFAGSTPAASKQYHTVQLFFQEAFNGTGYVGFSTDQSQSEELVPMTGEENGSWGLFLWGQAPWGGVPKSRPWIQWVPRDKQRCSQMNLKFKHSWGYAPWKMTGVVLLGEEQGYTPRRS